MKPLSGLTTLYKEEEIESLLSEVEEKDLTDLEKNIIDLIEDYRIVKQKAKSWDQLNETGEAIGPGGLFRKIE